jgi:hypothetical protein
MSEMTKKEKEYRKLINTLRFRRINNESAIDNLKNRNNEIDRTIMRYNYYIEEIKSRSK